jgi:hypothetical protein
MGGWVETRQSPAGEVEDVAGWVPRQGRTNGGGRKK